MAFYHVSTFILQLHTIWRFGLFVFYKHIRNKSYSRRGDREKRLMRKALLRLFLHLPCKLSFFGVDEFYIWKCLFCFFWKIKVGDHTGKGGKIAKYHV